MYEQRLKLLQDVSSRMNENCRTEHETIKCFATIATNTSFGLRVNTIPSFYQANQLVSILSIQFGQILYFDILLADIQRVRNNH